MLEKLKEDIDTVTKIIETLPKNTLKNKDKYYSYLEEVKGKYSFLNEQIKNELILRYEKYKKSINKQVGLTRPLDSLVSEFLLTNEHTTSYQKLEFDRLLYDINHFYKDNLEQNNINILKCIEIFKNAGIILTPKDFNYGSYACKYIENLLNGKNIKECFEEIYWKCPNIFVHIQLNLKYLFYKNKNIFDKYVINCANELFKDGETVNSKYAQIIIKNDELLIKNSLQMLDKFRKKELNLIDYQTSKIEKCYQYFTSNENYELYNENINNLYNSVIEYNNYNDFKYIIEKIKIIYNEKDKYKNVLKSKMKLIKSKEKKINSKILRASVAKQEKLINELADLYDELDIDMFCDAVYQNLNDDSTVYDALLLASSYFSFIVKCMKDNKIVKDNIKEQEKLIKFLINPYNTLIKNIVLNEERDIPLIISDKYKLLGMNISKDSIENNKEIIDNANKIKIYNKFILANSYDVIKFMLDVEQLIK